MESSDRIRIGIICECKEGEDYGWLYSYYGYSSIYGEKPLSIKLFYLFRKSKTCVARNGTVVAFVSLNDECGHAVNITNITEIPFLYAESNEDEKKYRKENILPYWEIHYPWRFDYCCLVYPYKKYKEQSLGLYYSVLSGKDLEIFMLLYSIHKLDFKYLSLDAIANDIEGIKSYVETFSLEDVLDTYKCGESGYFQYRPGRDDSFITTKYKEINTDDEFITSLIPLCKEIDSYACVGRGIDDNDYDTINKEDTEEGKRIVRDNYSKGSHLAYLISAYFEKYYGSKNKYENLLLELEEYKLSDRFRFDYFGYGNFSYEFLSDRIKTLNARALKIFEGYRKIK